RFSRDWSSDVCSSDLRNKAGRNGGARCGSRTVGDTPENGAEREHESLGRVRAEEFTSGVNGRVPHVVNVIGIIVAYRGPTLPVRSEERRVGEEGYSAQ